MTAINLDAFTLAYIEAALWSSTGDDGEPLDSKYSVANIAPEAMAQITEECDAFQECFGAMIEGREEEAAHDFWLTRCGHGCGFWDGGWSQPYPTEQLENESVEQFEFRHTGNRIDQYGTIGDYLTAMSKPYGEFNLYVGDDGMIHGS
jgi:hypothetical protein